MKKTVLILSILLLLFVNKNYSQSIIYVNVAATGANTGAQWNNAYTSLEVAINASNPGDEIWVKSGNYQPVATGTSFVMKEGVKIYGGFPSSIASPTFADRDWENEQTLLLGNGSSVVNNNDNSLTTNAVLDGFYVRNGTGSSTSHGISNVGGGIKNEKSSPFIRNCVIEQCTARYGGGAYNAYCSPIYENVIFRKNIAIVDGGGVNNVCEIFNPNDHSSPYFINVIIEENEAQTKVGGGIMNDGCEISVINSIIRGNKAVGGGGIYNTRCYYKKSLTYMNVLITGNVALTDGGGIYLHESGTDTDIQLLSSTVSGNYAKNSGAGIYNVDNNITIKNSIIWGNKNQQGTIVDIYNQSNNHSTRDLKMSYSCFNNITGIYVDNGNNLNSDPLFANYQYSSGSIMLGGDFQLTENSSVIDMGTNRYSHYGDLNGAPRIVNGTIDMGCYEWQFPCNILYVDCTNTDANYHYGTTWESAFLTLTEALDYARTHPCIQEIWVAKGNYFIGNSSYKLVSNVSVYGGFAGNETTLSQRNIQNNLTILSNSRTHGAAVVCNNFTAADPLLNSVIDGFTITAVYNGMTAIPVNWTKRGGGLCNINSSINIRNCKINNCYGGYGGGIYNEGSDVIIENCQITENQSTSYGGGGIYNNSLLRVYNTSIYDNISNSNGGGIYNTSPDFEADNLKLFFNIASSDGGGIYNYFDFYGISNMSLNRLNISNNKAGGNGAGIYHSEGPSLNINNSLISCNLSNDKGGGLYCYNIPITLINVTISGNNATNNGRAIYIDALSTRPQKEFRSVNSIIYNGNIKALPPIPSSIYFNNYSMQYTNSIVGSWINGGVYTSWSPNIGTNVAGSFIANPEFVSNRFVGYYSSTNDDWRIQGNFRLSSVSPAIDAGTNSAPGNYDLDGNNRIYNGIMDIGCYEYMGTKNKIAEEIIYENDHLNNQQDIISVKVYPNPVSDNSNLNIEIDIPSEDYSDLNIEIFNISGAKVMSHNISGKITYISMPETKGQYLIKITSPKNNFIKTEKVIVM